MLHQCDEIWCKNRGMGVGLGLPKNKMAFLFTNFTFNVQLYYLVIYH